MTGLSWSLVGLRGDPRGVHEQQLQREGTVSGVRRGTGECDQTIGRPTGQRQSETAMTRQ